jgi:hypothetical protein
MTQHYRYGTQIKIKTDYCIDCGKLRHIHSLKRCDYCYKIHNLKARQDRIRERSPELVLEQKLLWEWYEEKIAQMKWRCENCGDRIVDKDKKYNHWHVCHVLGKEHFQSVKTHDLNWWEGCHTCHTLYDNYLQNHDERLMQMRIFEKVVSIIQQLKPFVKESRRLNNLPEFILQKLK